MLALIAALLILAIILTVTPGIPKNNGLETSQPPPISSEINP